MSNNKSSGFYIDGEPYALGHPFFHACLSFVIIPGCCLNMLVILAILTNVKIRVRENVLHLNLACIDVTLLFIASLPIVITHIVNEYVREILMATHCILFVSMCLANFFALLTIAVLRVKRFTQYDYQLSKCKLRFAVTISWFFGCCMGFIMVMTSQPIGVCGDVITQFAFIPQHTLTVIKSTVFGVGTVILIATFSKCVLFLLQLKNIHPAAGNDISITYNKARSEIQFNDPATVPRRVSISAIVLDMFQTTSEYPTNTQLHLAPPSPHFIFRKHLVMTTFILITCSILLQIIPIGVGTLLFGTIPISVTYLSITLNSCLTPLIYICRYHHFRQAILDFFKMFQSSCRCGTHADTH